MSDPEKDSLLTSTNVEVLRASVKNLHAVFNGLYDAVFIHTDDGTVLDVNAKALGLFRMDKENVVGRNIASDFLRPRNPLKKLSAIGPKLADGKAISFQWVAKRAGDSPLFPVEIFVRAVQWNEQDVLLTTIRDITRRSQIRALLKRRRKQLALILDGNPIPTFVIDTKHRVILWNRACEKLTGVSKAKALGKPIDSGIFYPGPPRPVLADLVLDMDRERIQGLYGEKEIAASAFIPEAFEATDRLTIQGISRNIHFLAARCRDADGEVVAAIETLQDITERTRALEACDISKKLLTEITANIPGVVYQYYVSPQGAGGFTFLSDGLREMFGLTPQNVIQDPELFFSGMDASVRELFQNFLRPDISRIPSDHLMEFEFAVEGGPVRKWIKNSALADVREDGEILWNGMLTDITKIKELERMRADVERMVRHDLKSPLMGIGGLSKLLLKEELSPKHRDFVDAIYHCSIKLLHMINHSMVLFKMEEGSYVLQPEEFDLIDMFHSLHEELLPSARGKCMEFLYLLDGRPLSWEDSRSVLGERILLESLFANLIQNAVEAAPEASRITISIHSKEKVHEVDIHNQGTIPESVRNNFFERYATCGKKYGSGIGTYSAMLIAKTHHGDIRFTTSEEEGTHLIVTLPK